MAKQLFSFMKPFQYSNSQQPETSESPNSPSYLFSQLNVKNINNVISTNLGLASKVRDVPSDNYYSVTEISSELGVDRTGTVFSSILHTHRSG